MFHPQGPTFWELARQALSSTERGYDLLATKFDYTPFRTPTAVFQAFEHELRHHSADRRYGRILDVCCGTGAAMEQLAGLCAERFVGIDISRGMLRQARRNLKARCPDLAFDLVRANFLNLPFTPTFDLAVCFGALGHVLPREEPEFIRQIHRSLVPGGIFAFVTHTMPPLTSPTRWAAHGFNAAMRIRNLLIRPPFIMYYLTFLWPQIGLRLKAEGFQVEAFPLFPNLPDRKLCRLVIAKKRAAQEIRTL